MFIFYLFGVGLPCRWIFCQFWLCEEAQCVYLRRHLGSLQRFDMKPIGLRHAVMELQLTLALATTQVSVLSSLLDILGEWERYLELSTHSVYKLLVKLSIFFPSHF